MDASGAEWCVMKIVVIIIWLHYGVPKNAQFSIIKYPCARNAAAYARVWLNMIFRDTSEVN